MKKLFLMLFLFVVATTYGVSAAADKTLIVYHVDQYGVPIQTPETFMGEESDQITLNASTSNFYTVKSPGATYNYTFTSDSEQSYTFKYANIRMGAPNSYFSMFFDTAYTYTGFVGAEYGGNLGYFNSVSDEMIRPVYTSSFGYTPTINKSIVFEVDFPAGNKFALTEMMVPKLFVNDSGNQVLPLEMLDPSYTEGQLDLVAEGITYEYWVSLDNKQTYIPYSQLTTNQHFQVTNIVGRVFFSQNLNYSSKRLYITSELPIKLVDDNLTNDELSGDTPIKGWIYKTPDYSNSKEVKLNTSIYLLDPMIAGTIKTNNKQDWDSGEVYKDATIELIEIDSSNNENVIATTKSDPDGTFSFNNQITSFNNIKIKVSDKSGYESYFYYIDGTSNKPMYLSTNNVSVGNLPEMLPQTAKSIYSWYTQPGENSFAEQSRSLNFLLVNKSTPSDPGQKDPDSKPDSQDNNNKVPKTGNDIQATLLIVLSLISIASLAALSYQRYNN